MKYISTRGGVAPVEFQDAVLMGLADDGGLLVPESIPKVDHLIGDWRSLTYPELAFAILRFFATDLPEADLRAMIDRTYTAEAFGPSVAPTVRVGNVWVTELWHGPTLAFKDVALQLLGNLFEYILARRGGRLNILGATSGDTGSAAIHGVRGRQGIEIFVMHPHGRVSPIQERQMTTVLDANVHNVAIEGSFDDCQRIMKELAGDLEFKQRHSLGAVNSVNWARVLAQVVYFFRAAMDVTAATGAGEVSMAVPTGNFGDVLAGWYAMRMGAPISELVLATNTNDILARFFDQGVYEVRGVVQTMSPSMDIQVASNFERYLFYRAGCDATRLCAWMDEFAHTGSLAIGRQDPGGEVDPDIVAGAASEEEVLATIRRCYVDHGYLLDPHTAVGVSVTERLGDAGAPRVCLATAHPAKFPTAIRLATGEDVARHPSIDALMTLPTRCQVLPNDRDAVRDLIEKTTALRAPR